MFVRFVSNKIRSETISEFLVETAPRGREIDSNPDMSKDIDIRKQL